MSEPTFHIEIGPTARQSKVVVNDVDVTNCIRGLTVETDVDVENGATKVTLRLAHKAAFVKLRAALDRSSQVHVEQRVVDVTALGDDWIQRTANVGVDRRV